MNEAESRRQEQQPQKELPGGLQRDKLVAFTAKNKKSLLKMAVLLTIGLFFMLLANALEPANGSKVDDRMGGEQTAAANSAANNVQGYSEAYLEQKVTAALSAIAGISNVSVNLTFAQAPRNEYAVDVSQTTREVSETDAQGGMRTTQEADRAEQLVLPTSGGSPVLLSQTLPVVQGVVVAASGLESGNNALLVTRALQSLLGVDANKIVLCPAKPEQKKGETDNEPE